MKADKVTQVRGGFPKINNSILGILAIFAIFVIVLITINGINRAPVSNVNVPTIETDVSGQASEVILAELQNDEVCKLIVGKTTIYDETTLAASLSVGISAYYAGYSVTVQEVKSDGCIVDINGNVEYLAIGQIQRVGPLYVTVKDVLQ